MRLKLTVVLCVVLMTSTPGFSNEGGSAALTEQNPFEIVSQLHPFTYAELSEMYPHLDDRLMQSLMYRIVESMKVPS